MFFVHERKPLIKCNRKTVYQFLLDRPEGKDISAIMFGMDAQGGQVFSNSLVNRVLLSLIKRGKVHLHNDLYYAVK